MARALVDKGNGIWEWVDMPSAADAAPPAIAVNSEKGSSPEFARADHTHTSSVQRKKLTTNAAGQVVWTFNPPFPAGKVPAVAYGVENSTGTNLPFVVNILSVDNTKVTLQAYKITQQSLVGVLLGAVNTILSPAPAGLIVHGWAAVETVPVA